MTVARFVRPMASSLHPGSGLAGCVLAVFIFAAMLASSAAASTTAPAMAPRMADNGSIGLRLVDVPASAHEDPRARVYIVDHLAPGTVINRRVEVSNTTASTVHVNLYSSAATIAKGSFLGAAGHTANDLSTWTSVRPGTVVVEAGGLVMASVTISVPRDASPGEKYGVIWAEARSSDDSDAGVIQVSRVGIRLYLSVGPGGMPAPRFTIDSLTAMRSPDGRPMVLAAVHNTGGRALDMYGTLRLLDGPGGLRAGPFPATLGTTLGIGDTDNVTIALDNQIPAGPWDARITLRSGLLDETARATITFPDAGASPPVSTTSTRPGWLYLVIAGIIGVLAVGVGATTVVLRRRRLRPSGEMVPTEEMSYIKL